MSDAALADLKNQLRQQFQDPDLRGRIGDFMTNNISRLGQVALAQNAVPVTPAHVAAQPQQRPSEKTRISFGKSWLFDTSNRFSKVAEVSINTTRRLYGVVQYLAIAIVISTFVVLTTHLRDSTKDKKGIAYMTLIHCMLCMMLFSIVLIQPIPEGSSKSLRYVGIAAGLMIALQFATAIVLLEKPSLDSTFKWVGTVSGVLGTATLLYFAWFVRPMFEYDLSYTEKPAQTSTVGGT
jgi:hypothetical protein